MYCLANAYDKAPTASITMILLGKHFEVTLAAVDALISDACSFVINTHTVNDKVLSLLQRAPYLT